MRTSRLEQKRDDQDALRSLNPLIVMLYLIVVTSASTFLFGIR